MEDYHTGDAQAYGFNDAQVTTFESDRDTFDGDLTTHVASQAKARADRITKDGSREINEENLRNIRRMGKANGVSDAQMSALGNPVGASQAAPTNATVPAAKDGIEGSGSDLRFCDFRARSENRNIAGLTPVSWPRKRG